MPKSQRRKSKRPRSFRDFYPTPVDLAEQSLITCLRDISESDSLSILDPGAGSGIWGYAAKQVFPNSTVIGIDIRDIPQPPDYDIWLPEIDYLAQIDSCRYDLIIGNPPYDQTEAFIRHSLQRLKPSGRLLFVLRLEYLASKGRAFGLWAETPLFGVWVCANRPSFIPGINKTDSIDYAIYVWDKAYTGAAHLYFGLSFDNKRMMPYELNGDGTGWLENPVLSRQLPLGIGDGK